MIAKPMELKTKEGRVEQVLKLLISLAMALEKEAHPVKALQTGNDMIVPWLRNGLGFGCVLSIKTA